MSDIPMDLKQLRYFVHVAEFGSYTKAADFLNIAQPILSRQIRRLEVDLGQNLFMRTGRGVNLTEAGTTLLEHSRGILHQVDHAYKEVTKNQLSGQVILGVPPTIARILCLPIINEFYQQLPQARIIIHEGLTAAIEEGLQTGRLDIGLLHNPAFSSDLDIIPVGQESLYLIAPEQDTLGVRTVITLKEVSALALILPSFPNTYRMLVEVEMKRIQCQPNIILEINSVSTILELVAQGMGYAILSHKVLNIIDPYKKLNAYLIEQPKLINKLYVASSNKRMMTKTQGIMRSIIEALCLKAFDPLNDSSGHLY